MPCYDGREAERVRVIVRENPLLKVKIEELHTKYQEARTLLCEALKHMEKEGILHWGSKELNAWWITHQVEDMEQE